MSAATQTLNKCKNNGLDFKPPFGPRITPRAPPINTPLRKHNIHQQTPSINTPHPRTHHPSTQTIPARQAAHTPSPSPFSTQSRANLGLKADILKGMFRDGHTEVLRHHRADVAGVQIGISNLGCVGSEKQSTMGFSAAWKQERRGVRETVPVIWE